MSVLPVDESRLEDQAIKDFNKEKQLNLDEFVFMSERSQSGFFNSLLSQRASARPSIQSIVEDEGSLLIEDRGNT